MLVWIWTAVVVLTLVTEFASMQLVSVWFSAGALAALILAACGAMFLWQILVFLTLSAVLLIFVRKLAKKLLDKGTVKMNADSLIGKKTTLLTAISSDAYGTLKMGDIVWNCISINDDSLLSGSTVEIMDIRGNKLIVKEIIK